MRIFISDYSQLFSDYLSNIIVLFIQHCCSVRFSCKLIFAGATYYSEKKVYVIRKQIDTKEGIFWYLERLPLKNKILDMERIVA